MNCLQGVAEEKCTQRVFTGPMISGFAGRVAGTSKFIDGNVGRTEGFYPRAIITIRR